MSVEDGYSSSNKEAIKNLYQSRDINIILTAGMYTKKSAGANQSALLKWLTSKEENYRFTLDAQGIGQKFFINSEGRLVATLPASFTWLDASIWNILNR